MPRIPSIASPSPGLRSLLPRRWRALALGLVGACASLDEPAPPDAAAPAARALSPKNPEPLLPLAAPPALSARKLALGRRLFHDPRLSRENNISCASCHDLARGGTDGRPRAVGRERQQGQLNTPTVLNSGLNFVQFWDGRVTSLEEQVDGPLQNPLEMGSRWDEVIAKLQRDPSYAQAFAALYPEGVSPANVRDAIATFERSLITTNSRFDRFLRGQRDALSADEQHGYALFKRYGCVSCHQGVNIGGNMFQRMGIVADYFKDRGGETAADQGRYNVTRREEDRHVFKVPSLRNIALTAPYLHDGSAATLAQVIAIMARYQIGRPLPPRDVDLIAGFLTSLTGEVPTPAREIP